jgi:uncharacterized protein YxjI
MRPGADVLRIRDSYGVEIAPVHDEALALAITPGVDPVLCPMR